MEDTRILWTYDNCVVLFIVCEDIRLTAYWCNSCSNGLYFFWLWGVKASLTLVLRGLAIEIKTTHIKTALRR